MKSFYLSLGVADMESSADEYTRRLGCRPDLLIPGEYALWRTDAVNLSIRKVGHVEVGLARGMGRAMWLGVAMLFSSDYLDGGLGGLSSLVPCASISIRFRVLSWSVNSAIRLSRLRILR